jgi:Flp pilus assembly pilin Flp
MIPVLRNAVARRRGQTMVEYALLLTAVSLSCLLALHNYGDEIGAILRASQARIAAVHLEVGRHDRRATAAGASSDRGPGRDRVSEGDRRNEAPLLPKTEAASPFGRMRTQAGVGPLRPAGALWARFAACNGCTRGRAR